MLVLQTIVVFPCKLFKNAWLWRNSLWEICTETWNQLENSLIVYIFTSQLMTDKLHIWNLIYETFHKNLCKEENVSETCKIYIMVYCSCDGSFQGEVLYNHPFLMIRWKPRSWNLLIIFTCTISVQKSVLHKHISYLQVLRAALEEL